MKGKVGANLAAFNPAIGHTTLVKSVQVCVSQNQPFTATRSGDGIVHPQASAVMTLSDGKSTIRIGTLPAP